MAAAGVHLDERIFESIAGQRILFIGAGEMIEEDALASLVRVFWKRIVMSNYFGQEA